MENKNNCPYYKQQRCFACKDFNKCYNVLEWIDASKQKPDLTGDVVAYINAFKSRPEVLYLAKQPFKHYFDYFGEEVDVDKIRYYINLEKLDKDEVH